MRVRVLQDCLEYTVARLFVYTFLARFFENTEQDCLYTLDWGAVQLQQVLPLINCRTGSVV